MANAMTAVFQKEKARHAAQVKTKQARLKELHSLVNPVALRWERTVEKNASDFHRTLKKILPQRLPNGSSSYRSAAFPLDNRSLDISVSDSRYFRFEIPGVCARKSGIFLSFMVSGGGDEPDRKIGAGVGLVYWPVGKYEEAKEFSLPSCLRGIGYDRYGREFPLGEDAVSFLLEHAHIISNFSQWEAAEKKIIGAMKQFFRNLAQTKDF